MTPDNHTTCRDFKNRRVSSRSSARMHDDDNDDDERDADTMSLEAKVKYRRPNPIKTSSKLTRLQAVQQLFFASINRTEVS